MQSFAVRAIAANGFRLTLDLSDWGKIGVSLATAIIRVQARASDAEPTDPAAIEFASDGANPVNFDPLTGLMWFASPGTATANLCGTYRIAAHAEFTGYELPLFGGSLTFAAGARKVSPTTALPIFDTAWIAAHPFGPTPVAAPLTAAVAAAQIGIGDAIVRAILFGG